MLMKKFVGSLNAMSEAAFCMLSGCLQVACAMLFCAFVLLLHMRPLSPEKSTLWYMILELSSSPVGVLLLGVIACALLEERSRR